MAINIARSTKDPTAMRHMRNRYSDVPRIRGRDRESCMRQHRCLPHTVYKGSAIKAKKQMLLMVKINRLLTMPPDIKQIPQNLFSDFTSYRPTSNPIASKNPRRYEIRATGRVPTYGVCRLIEFHQLPPCHRHNLPPIRYRRLW